MPSGLIGPIISLKSVTLWCQVSPCPSTNLSDQFRKHQKLKADLTAFGLPRFLGDKHSASNMSTSRRPLPLSTALDSTAIRAIHAGSAARFERFVVEGEDARFVDPVWENKRDVPWKTPKVPNGTKSGAVIAILREINVTVRLLKPSMWSSSSTELVESLLCYSISHVSNSMCVTSCLLGHKLPEVTLRSHRSCIRISTLFVEKKTPG